MPFALKNRLSTLQIVLPYNQRPFTWQPNGDPGGEDIQVIPDELRNDVSLIKAVKLGNLELVEEEETIEAAYTQQRDAHQARAMSQAQQVASHMDRSPAATAEMVGLPCIASRLNRPGVRCEVPVVLPLSEKDSRPPLCTEHAGLAPQYARVDGEWVRMRQTAASNREGNPQS